MVEAIGLAILSAVSSAGVAGAAAFGTATVLGISGATLVGTATVLGGSLLLRELTTPDVRQRVAGQQYPTSQTLPPRRRAYGQVKLSGPFVVKKSYGGSFYTDIYLADGPIGGIDEIWLDDVKAGLPPGALSGPSGVDPWQDNVRLEAFLGTPDQAASSLLAGLPNRTAEHRLRGCAHIVMQAIAPKQKNFTKSFPSGTWPATRAVIRGARVRDTNQPSQTEDPATWAYTPLCGPCIRDFITHPDYGLRLPLDLVDELSFRAFTNLCFEPVADRTGALFPRYTLGGLFELTDQMADTLQGMLDACDGRFYLTPEGRVGITGGRYIAPEVTIPARAIISIGSLEVGNGRRATVNRLKTSFVSPHHDYQVIEGATWDDAASQAALEETLEGDFPRPWVQNHNQLQRLAKIEMARKNPAYRIVGMVTNLEGAAALFEDTVFVDLSRYGLGTVPFAVDRPVLSADGATCVFDLSSIDPDAWTFNAAIEEGEPPAPPDAGGATPIPPLPAGLALAVERRVVSGSTAATFLRLTATPSTRADLSLIGRYRLKGTGTWTDMIQDGENDYSLTSGVLADASTYEVQGALATYGRASQSAWTPDPPLEIVATADATPPGPPTGFVASGGAGQYAYAFTAPNSANFGSARVYRGTTTNFAEATPVFTFNGSASQSFDRTETGVAPGTYRIWVRALNRSGFGDASSTVGPITVTVT